MPTAILHAGIGQLRKEPLLAIKILQRSKTSQTNKYTDLKRRELNVGILRLQPALQHFHSLLGLHCLGPNQVGNLQVQSDILPSNC